MPNERVGTERLLSLPTRGLFAESMLGHCPSAEEINPILFTDWASSPCPDKATAINPVDTGSRAQAPSLTPSQLPNPVVNIVNPPAAPDPMGLAAALKVLGTPNIFRDMSAATELSQLLQTLVNDATSLVKSGSGTGGAPGGKSTAGTVANSSGTGYGSGANGGFGSSGGGNAPSPGTPQNVGEVNDLASGIRKQLPPAQANALVGQLYQNVVDKAGTDAAGGLINDPRLVTGSLVPTNKAFPSGGQRLCFPVSAFQTSDFASGFGTLAERYIQNDYCDTLGCSPASTYLDNNNPTVYKTFIVTHNPSFATGPNAASLAAEFPGVKRPDIMSDDGARKDFYEIKPLSPSGAIKGVGKLIFIVSFMYRLNLPYVAGTAYTPAKDIPIMNGTILGCNIGISLNVQRFVPGIVTYSVCFNGELAALLGKVTVATLLAWIAAQMLTMAGGALVVA
jgi:hypothetical protein